MNTTKRWILASALIVMCATSGNAQTSGLNSREPIGAYLNGNLPANITSTGYKVVEAFPALRFKDPIRLVPRPGTNELWVLCQDGEIWAFDKTNPATKSLLLDIKDVCVGHDEGEGDSGLLGIAFHPQFGQAGSPNRGYIYLWYSYRPPGADNLYFSYNRLSRFTLADGAATISPASEMVMINQYDRKTWHNGGGMFFGPDGFLYVTNGDEGDDIHDSPGTYGNAQKINDGLFSGVLRIDVDMNPARSHAIRRQPQGSDAPPAGWPGSYSQNYYIPNDNPWIDPGGAYLEEFYAIGLRSPHSLAYDAVTGKALIAETGQSEQEEIDVLAKGANYQWAFLEGTLPGPAPDIIGPGTSTPPIYANGNRTVDGSAVIGGWVYRGGQFAADLGGKYVFGDFISNKIWALDWQTPGGARRWLVTVPRIPGSTTGITNLNVDAANELYITMHGPEGRIYKLALTGATTPPPATLSGTGAFANLATLTPAAGIVPFNVNSSLWSDGAEKNRWIAVPNDGAPYGADETVTFAATGQWSFPVGTVTIKHFEMPVSESNPALRKRLETRFIVRTTEGWYGLTYRWRADGSDADLVPETGASEDITITQADGSTRVQRWDFPSRENCMACHNQVAGFALGANTRQLNGSITYPSTGITANQLATWSAIGMFNTPLTTAQISGFAKTVAVTDTSATLEQRMRSYLDANCSHCHQPGGVMRAEWDARFDTPLAQQGIVDGVPQNDFGISGSKIILPGDNDKSLLHIRINDGGDAPAQMPPLGRNLRHDAAVDVLRLWIAQLARGGGNQAPALIQQASQTSARGVATSLRLSATDPDGNALTYSATGLPPGLSISPTTGLISGTIATNAASSYNVTVAVTDGLFSVSKSFRWTTSAPPAPVGSLSGTDIAPMVAPGSTSYNAGTTTFTVQAYGSQINDMEDNFHFSYQVLAGDGEIIARITSQSNSNEWADAGVMIREALTTGSRHAYVGTTPVHGFAVKDRATTGGTTTYIEGPPLNAMPNNWVRLVRSGNDITSYTSANGVVWRTVNTATFTDLPTTLYAGLAFASVDDAVPGIATFDNVQVTGTEQSPAPPAAPAGLAAAAQGSASILLAWNDVATNETGYRIERASGAGGYAEVATIGADSLTFTDTGLAATTLYYYKVSAINSAGAGTAGPVGATTLAAGGAPALSAADIGAVGVAGSTTLANGVYTVTGSGSDIYNTVDSFHFASASITGDGEIKARVTSQTNTGSWAKAGVMMRESMSNGSRHAMMYITPYETGNGFEMLERTETNGPTTDISGPANNAPPNNWVRLVRVGNTITGYASGNGTTWTQVHTANYTALPTTLHVGLAVTSVNNNAAGTATFDNVLITGTAPPGYPSGWNEWLASEQLTAANVDADFNSDLMEYVLGEDPRSGVTGGGLTLVKGEDGRFAVSFRHPTAVADVDYVIETSADLQSWSAIAATPILVDGADGFRSVTYAALDGLLGTSGGATVFVRLRVTHRASGAVATGEPLSLQRIPFAAGSHTMGYANVKPPVFAGLVSGMTSDSLNLGAGIMAAPALRYYLEVRDGPFAGHRFDIATFSGGGAVIDLSSVRNTASALPDLTGASIVIRPHVKLDEMLDKWTLIGGRSSSLSDKASFYDGSAYASYWLFNATPADPSKSVWIRTGDANLVDAGGRIIAPAEGMFVSTVRDTSMILGGHVRTNPFVQVVRPGQNFLAQPFPLPGSPSGNGLSTTNGLLASRQKSSADQLAIWRGDVTGGPASFSTLWYAQIGSAAIWVSADDASLANQSAADVFQPHRAAFLKRSQPVTTTVLMPVRWTAAP